MKQIGTICFEKIFTIFASLFIVYGFINEAKATAPCTSGYTELTGAGTSFMAPVNGLCKAPGYSLVTIPDEYELFYIGTVVGDEVTLCDGGRKVNGTCTTYGSGDCDSGYYDLVTDSATFGSPNGDTCSNPYSARTDMTRCDHNPGDTCVTIATPTIDVSWYDGETVLSSETCYYGDTIEIPSVPARNGYTFNGWVYKTN